NEMYVQGMSTSLPIDVQTEFLRTIPGLEKAEIMRPGYAIEYDCLNPTQLTFSLEVKKVANLFSAGQANGTSGYEEAAAQGLIAGINAALKVQGKDPFVLSRSDAYIGVLIDDLVTKGTQEPYRMMTSRAEYRLILRQDNADLRLTEKGRSIGLVSAERYAMFQTKKQAIDQLTEAMKEMILTPTAENQTKIRSISTTELKNPISLYDLLKRSEMNFALLQQAFSLPEVAAEVAEQIEIASKYEGYIEKQFEQVARSAKLEAKKLPSRIDYESIQGLSLEARQKLGEIQPVSLGQASRISGVSPADISILLIYLEQQRRKDGI
ncbi:MAG: FAD-dependent oxidoreductase, partial [Sporomusaceae bacterium]|nr:FAD-dependent oxidoreductase [Sporomusaceae bacterium]